jgi:hypothetical protein
MKSAWEVGHLMVLFKENGNRYPEEYLVPLSNYVKKKYGDDIYPYHSS